MRLSATFALAVIAGLLSVPAPAGAQTERDTLLQRIKQRGVMRACASAYLPWNIKNPATEQWEGINADVITEVAKALAVKIEYVDVTWATVIPSLQSDKCDIAVSALWTSPARAEQVTFTRPIGADGMTLFVPDGSQIKSYADADQKGRIIVVRSGSGEERLAREMFPNADVRAITSEQAGASLLEVAAGRADLTFAGYSGNAMFLVQNRNIRVRALPELQVNATSFAFALPAREYFFRDYINIVIGNLETSGQLQKIKDRYVRTAN